jgi:tRNA threonylcarbamoyl adenosine modification protein YeaZ
MDTSTPAVTVGLVDTETGRVVASRVTVDPRAHTELLSPHVAEVLAEAGRSLAQVDALVVGIGPGPFTGLRVGIATAAALGQAADVPVHGVCGLDAIAALVPGDGPLVVATDARRKELYWAGYSGGHRTSEPAVDKPDEIVACVRDGMIAGSGAELYPAVFAEFTVAPQRFPEPLGLAGAADLTAPPGELVPLYLRRPDAKVPGAPKRVTP